MRGDDYKVTSSRRARIFFGKGAIYHSNIVTAKESTQKCCYEEGGQCQMTEAMVHMWGEKKKWMIDEKALEYCNLLYVAPFPPSAQGQIGQNANLHLCS